MTVWVVRSGRYGERETLALDNGVAVIGWEEMPDLSTLKVREDLRAVLNRSFPTASSKTLTNWESQLWPFAHVMQVGDLVVMPLKTRSAIAIGRVKGPYVYRQDLGDARHTRPVEWLKEVQRNEFAQDLLYSFGSFMTVCRVSRNRAEERVLAVLSGKPDPMLSGSSMAVGRPVPVPSGITEEAAPEETAVLDLAEIADDAIRMKIGTAFRGHGLSSLIGEVLKAQGYHAVVSPPGADGGVDIVAGRGALGMEGPRLVVQVKSQDKAVDVPVLRELQGVMRQFNAEQGLLVAWGGVTKALQREAQRLFFEIRIWDAGDVVTAIQQVYEKLPEEVQADLPMKRIWVLTEQE
ncbi:restriction endonuclease [Phreatobacter stygius]|uniref:Restriction endonuclease n=1 Tax=Phreatobacter stygius TaxID=1940610 RepID=A0A4D7BIT6_9HYPH|nr:restriction endonuclease [Phreatobacter stygius]QCI67732.1 restriction endonuclease [Phreatobacter stygius]